MMHLMLLLRGSELIVKTDVNKDDKINNDNNTINEINDKISIIKKAPNNKKEANNSTEEEVKIEKRKLLIKKARNIFFIILFNVVFPYIIYLASNLNNNGFYAIRESRIKINISLLFFSSEIFRIYGGLFLSFIYEFTMIYGLYFFFKAIFRKSLKSNIALAIVFNVISIISYYKIGAVAKPFWPEDILLVGNAFEIAEYGNVTLEPIIIIQIFVSVAILVVQWLITKYSKYESKLKNVTRIIMAIAATAVLCVISLFNWTEVKGFEENNYIHEEGYYKYGANV